MEELRLGLVERKFADIIWKNEPLHSRQLVALCEKELGWKKSTTYTVLKRLCEKGIFCNENGTVQSLMSKEEFNAAQCEQFVDSTFGGSLPAFMVAFTKRKQLSDSELAEIQKMISKMGGK